MPYTSLAQLTDRYSAVTLVSLTDRGDPAAGVIDTDVIDRSLADADAVIDGYLMGRYKLPLAATPALIMDLALAISFYKLHRFEPNPKVEKEFAQALATLRDISKGVVTLDVAGVEPMSGGDGAQVTDREQPFSEDKMTGFI